MELGVAGGADRRDHDFLICIGDGGDEVGVTETSAYKTGFLRCVDDHVCGTSVSLSSIRIPMASAIGESGEIEVLPALQSLQAATRLLGLLSPPSATGII